jgi:hypothetical protein
MRYKARWLAQARFDQRDRLLWQRRPLVDHSLRFRMKRDRFAGFGARHETSGQSLFSGAAIVFAKEGEYVDGNCSTRI